MQPRNSCANCGRAIDGPEQAFCPACGQPTPARRIDWPYVRDQFRQDVLEMDRGLLHTLKRLMLQPGHLIRDYLEGRRAGIVKPLVLVSLLAAVVLLLTKYVAGASALEPIDAATANVASRAVNGWINQNLSLFTLLLLPIEAFAFQLAFRRFRSLNYPEWLVILAFLTSQGFVLWCICALFFQRWLPPIATQSIVAVGAMIYAIASLMQFFRDVPRRNILLRGLLAHALFVISQYVIIRLIENVVALAMS